MKFTYEPIHVYNKYILKFDTMFGDADLYKSERFEIEEKDLEKTMLEFLAFTQAPNKEIFEQMYDNDELNGHFSWLKLYPYEYDLNQYGKLQRYSLIHYDSEGQKYEVKLSDTPDFTPIIQHSTAHNYPEKAISYIEKILLEPKIQASNNKLNKIKI